MDWIELLLDEAELPARSLRQYRAALSYWAIWHRLRYATALPLSETTRQAVGPALVDDFLADHTPVARDGRVCMRMADDTDQGLREAGYNHGVDCVKPQTTYWRITVLSSAHRLAELPFDGRAARRKKGELNAIYEAERAAVGAPVAVPMSGATIVSEMLRSCSNDWKGVRDAALIVLAQHLTTGQICQLKFDDWKSGEKSISGRMAPSMELEILEPFGAMQTFDRHLCLVGDDAQRLEAWREIRCNEGAVGADPFLARAPPDKVSPPLSDNWICSRFRAISQRAGIAGAKGRSPCSPNAIRKAFERECWELSNLVLTARGVGIGTQSVLKYRSQVR